MDLKIVERLYDKYKRRLPQYSKIEAYYKKKTDAKLNYPQTDRSNIFETYNFIKKFTLEEVSFMVGSPITYIAEPELVNAIERTMKLQKGNIDTELALNMLKFGEAYEMHYINKGKLKSRVTNPLNSIALQDNEGEVILFLYIYKSELDDKVYIDVIDDKYIYRLNEQLQQIDNHIPHPFKCCPVGVAPLLDGINDTLFSEIKELQDAYEITQSTYSNEIQDTRLAYLALYGASITEEQAKEMKKLGIIQLPMTNAKAEYLVKNLSPEFIQNHINGLEDKMYQISQHINHNIGMVSNLSGTALENRLIALRNKITTNCNCLTDCIKKRVYCICQYENITKNNDYNSDEVTIKYTMNIPSNDVEMADIISKLNGKLSTKTALRQLSFITNAEEEFKAMMEEQKALREQEMNLVQDITPVGGDINAEE